MYKNFGNSRVIGFAAPFLFGALVGGASTAYFNPYRPRPVYYGQPYNPYY